MKRALMLPTFLASACFADPTTEVDRDDDSGSSSGSTTTLPPLTSATSGSHTSGDDGSSSTGSKGAGTGGDSTSSTSSTSSSSSSGGVELPAPVARWSFDNTVSDDSGNGYDAVLVDTATYSLSPNGYAVRFDGGGHIDLSAASSEVVSALGEVTLTFLIRADEWSVQPNTFFALGVPGDLQPADNAFALRVEDGLVTAMIENGNGIDGVFPIGQAPPAEEWHRLTFVLQGEELAYFVDGEEVASGVVWEPDSLSETLVFGTWSGGNYFLGLLDDAAIYDEALSERQISML